MNDKKFNAILAKNAIAREIRDYFMDDTPILDLNFIVHQLKEIENVLGQANQPSIDEIMTSDYQV